MSKRFRVIGATLAGALAATSAVAAWASTPAAWDALDRRSTAACLQAAGLLNARVGPPTRFSDRIGVEVRTVTGTWPQPHMRGASASLVCVYDRRTRRAETQELTMASTTPAPTLAVKDVWWRAEDIGGRGVVDRAEVTLLLGSDGKIGGRSGCNQYSANYQLEGDRLRVFPPMIGTRMACPPALMDQEARYRGLLERASRVEVDQTGALSLFLDDGRTLRFRRAG
jgi:heat shock protein HslJ